MGTGARATAQTTRQIVCTFDGTDPASFAPTSGRARGRLLSDLRAFAAMRSCSLRMSAAHSRRTALRFLAVQAEREPFRGATGGKM